MVYCNDDATVCLLVHVQSFSSSVPPYFSHCFPQLVCSVTPVYFLPSLLWTASSFRRSVPLASAACPALRREDGVRSRSVCVCEREGETREFISVSADEIIFWSSRTWWPQIGRHEPHCTEHSPEAEKCTAQHSLFFIRTVSFWKDRLLIESAVAAVYTVLVLLLCIIKQKLWLVFRTFSLNFTSLQNKMRHKTQ